MTTEPPNIFVLFLLGLAIDILWCLLVKSVADRKALRAATLSSILEGFKLATAWLVITHNSALGALAFIVGCFFGTYFSTRIK